MKEREGRKERREGRREAEKVGGRTEQTDKIKDMLRRFLWK